MSPVSADDSSILHSFDSVNIALNATAPPASDAITFYEIDEHPYDSILMAHDSQIFSSFLFCPSPETEQLSSEMHEYYQTDRIVRQLQLQYQQQQSPLVKLPPINESQPGLQHPRRQSSPNSTRLPSIKKYVQPKALHPLRNQFPQDSNSESTGVSIKRKSPPAPAPSPVLSDVSSISSKSSSPSSSQWSETSSIANSLSDGNYNSYNSASSNDSLSTMFSFDNMSDSLPVSTPPSPPPSSNDENPPKKKAKSSSTTRSSLSTAATETSGSSTNKSHTKPKKNKSKTNNSNNNSNSNNQANPLIASNKNTNHHNNRFPIICESCGVEYSRIDALKRHQRMSQKYGGICRAKRGRISRTEKIRIMHIMQRQH